MQRPLSRRTLIAGTLAAWATAAGAAPRPYALVRDGSTISFTFTANGTQQSGTVPIESASILVDLTSLANSRAEVSADIRKARTGFLLATQALKSPEVLDADTHPIVRFTSTRIRLGARGRISEGAEIDGQLRLRGVTRPLTLSALLSRPAGTAPDDLSVLYIQLAGSLSRAAYGATGYAGMVDDQVALDIRTEIRALA